MLSENVRRVRRRLRAVTLLGLAIGVGCIAAMSGADTDGGMTGVMTCGVVGGAFIFLVAGAMLLRLEMMIGQSE